MVPGSKVCWFYDEGGSDPLVNMDSISPLFEWNQTRFSFSMVHPLCLMVSAALSMAFSMCNPMIFEFNL